MQIKGTLWNDNAVVFDLSNSLHINLSSNRLNTIDLSPMNDLLYAGTITNLNLSTNALKAIDLEPLANCKNLLVLALFSNQLTQIDLGPMANFDELIKLYLHRNKLTKLDLRPLAYCDELLRINLDHNHLSTLDLTPLRYCFRLKYLEVDANVRLVMSADFQEYPLPPALTAIKMRIKWVQPDLLEFPFTEVITLESVPKEHNDDKHQERVAFFEEEQRIRQKFKDKEQESQRILPFIKELLIELKAGDEVTLTQAAQVIVEEGKFKFMVTPTVEQLVRDIVTELPDFEYIRLKKSFRRRDSTLEDLMDGLDKLFDTSPKYKV